MMKQVRIREKSHPRKNVSILLLLMSLLLNAAPGKGDWQSHSVPLEDGIHKIFFLNESLGWAITYGTGKVVHTADGGENWAVQAALNSEFFERILFVNERLGYVCGDYGYVYKTVDGGQNWLEISPPLQNRITDHYRTDTSEVKTPDGWFVAYYFMEFFDERNGFVSGFKFQPKDQRNTFARLFFKTEDGGASWHPLEGDESKAYREAIDFSDKINFNQQAINGVFYLNEKTGWKVQNQRGGKKLLKKSSDGGATWTESELPDLGTWIFRNIIFLDENNGLIAGGERIEVDGELQFGNGILLESKDGGTSWQRLPVDYPAFHDIVLSPDKIWLVGQDGTILSCKRD